MKDLPKLIVFYNTGFGLPLINYYPSNMLYGRSCEISANRSRMVEADAVVFHLPDMGDISNIKKKAGQVWVLWSQECEENYPIMKDEAQVAIFDIRMTYRLDSDVVHSYFCQECERTFRLPIPPKSQKRLVCVFVSSMMNLSGRLEYLNELMKYIDVHSYGKVFRNKKLSTDNGRTTKSEIIGKYKFYLAFENAIGKDYVTEKFYDTFIAGTVPIYMGAPNIEDLSPGRKSFINVNDFENPAELAFYLHNLNNDPVAYNSYFLWKKEPFKEPFKSLAEKLSEHLFYRLYEEIKKRRQGKITLI